MFYKSYHSTDQEWHGEGGTNSGVPVLTTVPVGHPKKLPLKSFKPNELKNIDKTHPMLMSDEAREWFKLVVNEECFLNHNIEDPLDFFQFKKFAYANWLATYNISLENLALREQISRDRGCNANITVLYSVGRFAWGDETISVGTGEMFIVRSDNPEKEPFFLCEVLKVLSTENDENDDIIKYKLCFWIKDDKATKTQMGMLQTKSIHHQHNCQKIQQVHRPNVAARLSTNVAKRTFPPKTSIGAVQMLTKLHCCSKT